MRKFTLLSPLIIVLSIFIAGVFHSNPASAEPVVRLCKDLPGCDPLELMTDFDGDGVYEPFIVKGIGYAPTQIGRFMGSGPGWSAVCSYVGPQSLADSAQRFQYPPPEDNRFTCDANGTNFYQNLPYIDLDEDMRLISEMQANTIRTWGDVTPQLLTHAQNHDLKIMAGYWISHDMDYVNDDPNPVINGFLNYVELYNDHPAVLMFGLSNENNISFCSFGGACNQNQQADAFFSLLNDIAVAAKAAHPDLKPIVTVTAEMIDLTSSRANRLTDIDIIGINSYRGNTFGSLYTSFANRFPDKPMLITEFGTDAWSWNSNPDLAHEDQEAQANQIVSAWDDILDHHAIHGGVSVGGVIFTYSDRWDVYLPSIFNPNVNNAAWTPSVAHQDDGFTTLPPEPNGDRNPWTAGQPDGRYNPEYGGLVAREKNTSVNRPDIIVPREAYYKIQNKFRPFRRGDANGDGAVNLADAVFTLRWLFQPPNPAPPCRDAADANDDGVIDISDALRILFRLFVDGNPPLAFPGQDTPGIDLTSDHMNCEEYPAN